MIRIEIFSKKDCCLCDDAKAVLEKVQDEYRLDLCEIDIESDPKLYERYKERIPIVKINGRTAFKYRVDEADLRRRLQAVRTD